MNQGKLEVVKQDMAIENIDILGISELKWTELGEFNSDDHYIYYCGQESLRRNGVALIINKSLKCNSWVQSQKRQNDFLPGAIMGGPTHDEVMKKIPGRQGRPGTHPRRGLKENNWQARPSRIRDSPGWPQPLPYPISSHLFCCCSYLLCCRFLCCLPRALLLLFHWIKTNLNAN